jgi:cell division protein FtsB
MEKIKKYHPVACIIIIVSCFLYLVFFSKNNFFKHRELNRQISDWESKIEKANNHINNQYTPEEIKNNPELLEKFAREELNLQKKDEDVFFILN